MDDRITIRMPAELRAAIDADREPGEDVSRHLRAVIMDGLALRCAMRHERAAQVAEAHAAVRRHLEAAGVVDAEGLATQVMAAIAAGGEIR